jgi:tetratricopeptide (TPR) repeat protein
MFMNKPQWIVLGAGILIVFALYAATEKHFFGPPKTARPKFELSAQSELSTDSVLFHAKEHLTSDQATRLNFLEQSISRGDVHDQKVHLYHQLARFWSDSVRVFEPYAWYTAEAARLENSEKSLRFAAHLFLDNLVRQNNAAVKQWEALQAKDLFERSLKINPANDSSKVGLGAVYVYGGIAMPMEGIGLIREVASRDTTNTYAQWTLAQASIFSGQLDKADERLKKLVQLQPSNVDVYLLGGGVSEQMGNKTEAIDWYTKVLPLIGDPELKKEVEAKIAELKK